MNHNLRVLVVDDEKISRQTTAQQLKESGYHAATAENAFLCLQRLAAETWDVVLTDLRMSNMDGIELLRQIKQGSPEVDVILMTAYGTVGDAVAAMHEGAVDFLTKPFDFSELEVRLKKLAEIRNTRRELNGLKASLREVGSSCGLVGQSPEMHRVYKQIELFANSSAPVLVSGETGTGKELVARAIHRMSGRSSGTFVPVACGAIPNELAESEIFGHERGAFTGAIQLRKGSFERADVGTLLLDDVDDLPMQLQPKLLRALQEGKIFRVGGERELSVDVRVIATTKVPLDDAVKENRFREDLYYRLRGLEIHLPPLRSRGDDVVLLAQHFLWAISKQEGSPRRTLALEALELLRRHLWPGNVRELRRTLESAVAFCPGAEIQAEHLPDYLREETSESPFFSVRLDGASELDFKAVVQEFETRLIHWAMQAAGGEQKRAAQKLGMPRTTLQSKLDKMQGS